MKNLVVAYILWFFFGFCGFHKFYLGHIGWGIFYFFTFGGFFIGWVIDFFLLPLQVENANILHSIKSGQLQNVGSNIPRYVKQNIVVKNIPSKTEKEHLVLSAAKGFKGKVTPMEVALKTKLPVEEAKKILDDFVKKGFIEQQISSSGVIVYVFAGFLNEDERQSTESF